jgi:glycosyltransferase involved in cell wall biosynthesis
MRKRSPQRFLCRAPGNNFGPEEMKVLFITTESMLDHSYTMIKELRKHITLDAIITAKKLTPELEEYCRKLDVKFFKRKSFKNPLSIFNEIRLVFYIRRMKPDVIWFNAFSFFQSLLVKLTLKKYIVNAHDIELHPGEKDLHGILSQKVTFSFYRRSIAVMSRTQAKHFKQKYGKEPHVLQLPVIDYYTAVSRTAPVMKTGKISSDGLRVNFLFFGSIMPYKGIEKLLEACRLLDEQGENYKLNIHGRLNYDHEILKEKISGLKNINFVNEFIDYRDICGIYDKNDVIVIPYLQVSQCGPLLIGFSRNMPAICSSLEGFAEYVDDGSSGLLFNNTAGDLAEKMKMLIHEPGQIARMREYIGSVVQQKFGMPALAPQYLKVFNQSK